MWYKTKTHVFQTSFTARRVKRGANEDDKWPATTEDGQTIVRIPYVESGTTSTDFFPAQSWIIVSLRDRTAERWGRQNACVWQTWQVKFLLFLWWSSLKLMFSDLFKKGRSSAKTFFKQNYCHACHTRFAVFFPLPSCCVLHNCTCNGAGLIWCQTTSWRKNRRKNWCHASHIEK